MQTSPTQTAIDPATNWQTQVHELVLKVRQYPSGSHQHNHYLTQIIRLIESKLWKFYTPYYADALQQTWFYFAKNVCTTYDPDRGSVVTWLNTYLRYRHQDLVNQSLKRQYHEVSIHVENSDREDYFAPAIDLPTRDYGSLSLLEEIIHQVRTDADGYLQRTHLKDRPDVNCQALILLRLPPETPWKEISTQFGVSIPTLSSFYRRHCIPYLRTLVQSIDLSA